MMKSTEVIQFRQFNDKFKAFCRGAIAAAPILLAVLPWSMLAGSFAIESGMMNAWQSQGMSLLIYGGAVQLALVGMLQAGVSIASILASVALITSRHLLYALTLRSEVSSLPLRWRMGLGFLLTDELFALINPTTHPKFDRWYTLGVGLFFYVGWNIATYMGIILSEYIESPSELGLDFTIAATFIAMVVPSIKDYSLLVCALVSTVVAVLCELHQLSYGILVAAPIGMFVGVLCYRTNQEREA